MTAPERCPLCEVAPQRGRRLLNGADLLQCPRCRLAWWDWPAFQPGDFYDQDYFQSAEAAKGYADYAGLEAGLRRSARARLRRIGRLIKPDGAPRTLLDVGCGTGVFLDEARSCGWGGRGVEVSGYAAGVARGRGFEVHCGAVASASLAPASLDAITLWDTIEHLPDPFGDVQRLSRALRPGGVLALSTGDVTSWCARLSGARWHLFNLPEHLFFFSPASLAALLERGGLRPVRWTREVTWAPVSYLRERLVKTLLRRAPRPNRRTAAGWVLPVTLLDIVGVYGVAPAPDAPQQRRGRRSDEVGPTAA